VAGPENQKAKTATTSWQECVIVMTIDTFPALVKAINQPSRDHDSRSTIVIERRLHDTVNAVVRQIRKIDGLVQYDSRLAFRLPDAKRPTIVTQQWLENHLRTKFQFVSAGTVVELTTSSVFALPVPVKTSFKTGRL
jgi:translation elongation factor EF-4